MKPVFINLSLFKIGWLAVVFSAAAGMASVGAAAVALIAIIHLLRADRPVGEVAVLVIAGLVGLAWESFLVQVGALSYPESAGSVSVAPYWIVAMWVLFATTLNVGMKWLRSNFAVAAVVGAIAGPLSFLAGEKAGAVVLGDATIAILALGWSLLLPAIARIAALLDGFDQAEPALAGGAS